MRVTDKEWYKDQVRLYDKLYVLSKRALEELDFISKTNGTENIRFSAKEISKREDLIREVRALFKKLDPKHTQVS